MSKKLRIGLFVLGGLLVLAAAGLFVLYQAAQHVPEFYRQALEVDEAAQAKAADRMDRQALELTGNVQNVGALADGRSRPRKSTAGWRSSCRRNSPQSLPPAMAESPRGRSSRSGIVLACQYQQGGLQSVLSLTSCLTCPSPACWRCGSAQPRAGLLPLPLDSVLKGVTKALKDADLDMPNGSRPAATRCCGSRCRHRRGQASQAHAIESLQLASGELCVEGTTEPET